jgi:hypothetical protein
VKACLPKTHAVDILFGGIIWRILYRPLSGTVYRKRIEKVMDFVYICEQCSREFGARIDLRDDRWTEVKESAMMRAIVRADKELKL